MVLAVLACGLFAGLASLVVLLLVLAVGDRSIQGKPGGLESVTGAGLELMLIRCTLEHRLPTSRAARVASPDSSKGRPCAYFMLWRFPELGPECRAGVG